MLISLFITCYNDTLFPNTGKAVVSVLERLGHAVEFREAQTCCGQMHYNTGYQKESLPLVRNFLRVYSDADVICVPSASCVAMIRDQYARIAFDAGDPAMAREVARVVPRVYEFSELLVDFLGIEDVGSFYPHTVTFHPSCHSLRSLRVGEKPYRLLRHVRGLTLVPLADSDQCCGFGGTFAIKNPDVSAAMLADKVERILATGAQVCTAGDNSCLMHMFGALHRQRTGIRTVHLAEILASTDAGE